MARAVFPRPSSMSLLLSSDLRPGTQPGGASPAPDSNRDDAAGPRSAWKCQALSVHRLTLLASPPVGASACQLSNRAIASALLLMTASS